MQKGFRLKHHADIYHDLMQKLGYDRYGKQLAPPSCLILR